MYLYRHPSPRRERAEDRFEPLLLGTRPGGDNLEAVAGQIGRHVFRVLRGALDEQRHQRHGKRGAGPGPHHASGHTSPLWSGHSYRALPTLDLRRSWPRSRHRDATAEARCGAGSSAAPGQGTFVPGRARPSRQTFDERDTTSEGCGRRADRPPLLVCDAGALSSQREGNAMTAIAADRPTAEPPVAAAAHTEDAVKIYGKGATEVRALDGVTVGFADGELGAIMGPSGSGKSTLLHCMAGLDTLTSGKAFIGDEDLSTLGDKDLTVLRRDRVGFVFQAFNLVPTLTALENVTLPLALAGRKGEGDWIDQVVGIVGLTDRIAHRPSELSGGQQQRVAVARALASRPQIIFADEPTGNLDSRSGAEVLGFLRRAVDEMGQTIVMVTHDPGAASYADRVLFLADGRLVDEMAHPTSGPGARPHEEVRGLSGMFRVTVKGLLAHKSRLAITALAVMLGVAFMAGTFVLTDTIRKTFDDLFGDVYEGTDAVAREKAAFSNPEGAGDVRGRVDESLLGTVAGVDGVATAEGIIQGYTRIIDKDGNAIGDPQTGAPTLGGNWNESPRSQPVRHRGGAATGDRQRDRHRQEERRRRRLPGGRHRNGACPRPAAASAARRHRQIRRRRQPWRCLLCALHHRRCPAPCRRAGEVRQHRRRSRSGRVAAGARRPDRRGGCRPVSRW